MLRTIFIGIGIFTTARYLLGTASTTVVNAVKLKGWRIENLNVSGSSIDMDLVMTLVNDLPFNIPSNAFTGHLYFGQKVISNVELLASEIPTGTEEKRISLSAPFEDIIKVIPGIIQNPNSLLSGLILKGDFISNGLKFPVEQRLI